MSDSNGSSRNRETYSEFVDRRRYDDGMFCGKRCTIRNSTEHEWARLALLAKGDYGLMRSLLIAHHLVDEDKQPIYTLEPEDLDEIGRMDVAFTGPLASWIERHNEEAMPTDEHIEGLVKN